ncbi:hypothetical protein [Vibrio hepatarius]|uniref:hypothetical protein n=1 Tax=Vibrio hepatarius TaxID=171383 RepID=UPI002FDA432D
MNSPKVFIATLFLLIALLAALFYLMPDEPQERLQAEVVTQTLTQSLDGHRKYLNVQLADGSQQLLSIPPRIDCPAGSIVELSTKMPITADKARYELVQCKPGKQ